MALGVSYINAFVFNCNRETKNFILVWCYMSSIEETLSSLQNKTKQTASFPSNNSSILLSINFIIFNFRRLKEDVRFGLPAEWRRGWGRRDDSWKVGVYFWLWLSYYSHFYIKLIFYYHYHFFFYLFASLFWRSLPIFMKVSFASSKSCTFFVLIFCPFFSLG